MSWFMRMFCGFAWVCLVLVMSCSSEETSPCGVCPASRRCDPDTKKCVPRNSCVSCTSSAECDNDYVCTDGCCVSSGVGRELDQGEIPTSEDASTSTEDVKESECPNPPCEAKCTTDADCKDAAKSKCDTQRGVCVGCLQDGDCSTGQTCQQGTCTGAEDRCKGVTCPTGEVCDPASGKCVGSCPDNLCKDSLCCSESGQCLACGKKQTCEPCQDHPECGAEQRCTTLGTGNKACVPLCSNDQCPKDFSCLSLGTKLGKLCIPDGTCKPIDRCENVTCNDGKKCCPTTGKCQFCCADEECPPNQRCIQKTDSGQCGVDPNDCKPACVAGELCNARTGKCEKNCTIIGCADASKVCDNGTGLCVPKDCRSNWTCPTGQTCNRSNGQCETVKDCRQNTTTCTGTTCCSQTTGQCVTDCRQCGNTCPTGSGLTCNRTTGVCQVATCSLRKNCSSDNDCCGLSCEFSVGHLDDRCRCKTDADCGPNYQCKSSLINKYCE